MTTIYYLNLSSFLYLINKELIKGNDIIFISNFGLPKSDKAFFKCNYRFKKPEFCL